MTVAKTIGKIVDLNKGEVRTLLLEKRFNYFERKNDYFLVFIRNCKGKVERREVKVK